jgi:small-conductance mechanosensitive channel
MAKFDPKKAGADADAMIKNLQTQPQAAEQVEVTPAAAPEPSTEQPVAVAESTAPVTAPPPAANAEAELLRKQLADADQRWKSLQGMIDRRDAELDQMRQLIATLQSPPKEPERPQPIVTKADEDAFGADMIDLNRRVAREEFSTEVNQLKQYIAKLEDRLGIVSQATVQTTQARFEERLAHVVPNWVAINEDPRFISWLGKYKMTALRAAYQDFDVDGVASFFNDFIATLPAPAAAPVQPSADDIVAPGKGSGGTPRPDSQAENVWTREDIARLYRDKQEGRISAAEFAKAEAEIFKQANAGKIAA